MPVVTLVGASDGEIRFSATFDNPKIPPISSVAIAVDTTMTLPELRQAIRDYIADYRTPFIRPPKPTVSPAISGAVGTQIINTVGD